MDEPLKKEISIYSFIRAELGGLFQPEDRLCVAAIPQGLGKTAKFCRTEQIFASREEILSSENLRNLRQRNNSGYSIYFSVCPLLPSATSRKAINIAYPRSIWADFDVSTPAMKSFLEGNSWEGIPAPMLAVSTSRNRYQFFWTLPKDDSRNVEEICAEVKKIAEKTGADTKVADPARVLRLPGFQNRKPGREGWNCRAYALSAQSDENFSDCPLLSLASWSYFQWISVGRAFFRVYGAAGVERWLKMSKKDTAKWPGEAAAIAALNAAPPNPWNCEKMGIRAPSCGSCRNIYEYLKRR